MKKEMIAEEGYTIIQNYFLDKWVEVLGIGPSMLYLQLLSYCYKGKDEAWPALRTLCKKMGIGRSTLIRYRQVLINHGLIKKIIRRKSSRGYFKNNIYQLTLILESLKQEKKKKDRGGPRMRSEIVPKWNQGGSNLIPGVVSKWDHNNNKEKNYQENNNNKIVAADFKKPKEERRQRIREIRDRLAEMDFKERFIAQLTKDFPVDKIEEKLELLKFRKNIQNPAGWLRAALKYDYQDAEKERCDEEEKEISKETKILLNRRAREKKDALPKEEALKRIRWTKRMLANL